MLLFCSPHLKNHLSIVEMGGNAFRTKEQQGEKDGDVGEHNILSNESSSDWSISSYVKKKQDMRVTSWGTLKIK